MDQSSFHYAAAGREEERLRERSGEDVKMRKWLHFVQSE